MTDDTQPYRAGLNFIATLGATGAELSDFVRTYGLDLSAVQLDLKPSELKKFLLACNSMEGVAKLLREVQLRQNSQQVPVTVVQRENFLALLVAVQKRYGMSALSRRLGMTRQALYAVINAGGPTRVSDMMLAFASLLGYSSVVNFLTALAKGVPDHGHVKIEKRKQAVKK